MTITEFNAYFQKLFPGAPSCFEIVVITEGKAPSTSLSLVKLDDWIMQTHGEYTGSMRERVRLLFGKEAEQFISQILTKAQYATTT